MKMDVKVIFVLVCVFVPCWVSASCKGISRDGPRHLPRRLPTRNAAPSSQFNEPEELVIGGRNSELGQFPFIVSLQRWPWEWDNHECGGSIITQQTVLTAAHCVENRTVDTLQVVAGKLHLKETEVSQQIRSVNRYVIHPRYTTTDRNAYDVALLFLKEPFEYNQFVGKIALADPMDNESSGNATVAGWGNMGRESLIFFPNTMQTAILSLMSHAECVAQMKKGRAFEVTETMLCTYNADHEPCHGDSGGPLFQGDKLIGIVSWKTSSVSGFTRVSSFMEWIMKEHMQIRKFIDKDDNRDINHHEEL